MNQFRTIRTRSFWWGVGLLSFSGLLWFFAVVALEQYYQGALVDKTELLFLVPAAILTGIGIWCVRRGIKRVVAEIETLDPETIIAKRKARQLHILEWILIIALCIVPFVLMYHRGISYWAVVGSMSGLAAGAGIASNFRQRWLKKAGHGVKALEKAGAKVEGVSDMAVFELPDRKVTVDEFEIMESGGGYPSSVTYTVPHTRIRVEHKGRIPCVIQVEAKRREHPKFFDKDVYMEWSRTHPDEPIPSKVKIYGRKVPTALSKESVPTATEWAKRILDDPNIAALKGPMWIDSDQILWVRREGTLPREFLEKAVKVLVSIAEKIEKQY